MIWSESVADTAEARASTHADGCGGASPVPLSARLTTHLARLMLSLERMALPATAVDIANLDRLLLEHLTHELAVGAELPTSRTVALWAV